MRRRSWRLLCMSWSLLLAFVVVVGIFIILFDSGFLWESVVDFILFWHDFVCHVCRVYEWVSVCPSVWLLATLLLLLRTFFVCFSYLDDFLLNIFNFAVILLLLLFLLCVIYLFCCYCCCTSWERVRPTLKYRLIHTHNYSICKFFSGLKGFNHRVLTSSSNYQSRFGISFVGLLF